jgi:hypothetical protein
MRFSFAFFGSVSVIPMLRQSRHSNLPIRPHPDPSGFSSQSVVEQMDQQRKKHWHAADVHQWWEKGEELKSG